MAASATKNEHQALVRERDACDVALVAATNRESGAGRLVASLNIVNAPNQIDQPSTTPAQRLRAERDLKVAKDDFVEATIGRLEAQEKADAARAAVRAFEDREDEQQLRKVVRELVPMIRTVVAQLDLVQALCERHSTLRVAGLQWPSPQSGDGADSSPLEKWIGALESNGLLRAEEVGIGR